MVEPAVHNIQYHQVQFGGIVLSQGSFKITGGASTRPYVGTSYHEIDDAWNDILKSKCDKAAWPIDVIDVAPADSNGERWFNLTAEEKQDAFGDRADEYLDFAQ